MKKYIICLLAALTIAGCSNNKEVGVKTTEETTIKEEAVKQTTESTAKKEETTQETTTESTVKAKEGKSLVIDTTVDRELNADELAAYNTDLAVNYNGFLTQDYETPEDIQWGEVFYNGIGEDTMTPEIKKALETKNDYEFMTATYGVKKSFVDEYMKKTTGIENYTPKFPIDTLFAYEAEYDLYFIDRGDTTYQEIKFTRGNIENGIVTLFFERKGMTGQTQNCEVRFKDTSEGYHFISCVGKDA